MAFTPSNLAIASLGSTKLTIATCSNGVSATDLWTSGIPDIQGVIPVYLTTMPDVSVGTNTYMAISWTQSTGTIHIMRPLAVSATAMTWYVRSGFVSDMTW